MKTIGIIVLALLGAAACGLASHFLLVRCPHCRRIGGWRFQKIGQAVEEKDDDGDMRVIREKVRCKSCGTMLDDVWSDFDRRRITEAKDGTQPPAAV